MDKEQIGIPKLRFPGFTAPWEQRKLGEVGKTFTGLSGKTKEDFGHGDAYFVTYMNVYSNPISDLNMVENVEIDTKQQEVKKGDVFFTTSSETPEEVGMSSVWLGDEPHIYLNSFCFGFRPTGNMFNPYYLAYLLRSNNIRNKMMILAQGISRYNISKNKVMKLDITIPNIREQKKIGEFFKQLDSLIALHQRKLEHLKQQKNGLLQKMFPKNGESVPEVRFPGFTDSWEQRKLGEISELNGRIGFRGYTVKDIVSKEDGGILTFSPTNIINNSLEVKGANTYITKEKYEESPEIKVDNGDILFVKTGSTLGKSALVSELMEPATINPQIVIIRLAKHLIQFLSVQFITNYVQKQITAAKIGGAVPTLTEREIKKFKFYIPNDLDETRKIGQFFFKLDSLITLHQRKLEHLELLKKGLLQQMFV